MRPEPVPVTTCRSPSVMATARNHVCSLGLAAQYAPRVHVPDHEHSISVHRGESAARVVERHGKDARCVAHEGMAQRAGRGIPEFNFARLVAISCGEQAAIGTVRHRADKRLVGPPAPERTARLRVPNDDAVIVGSRDEPGQGGVRGQALGSVDVAGEQSPLAAALELVEPGASAGAKSGHLVNRQVMAVGAERDDLPEPGPRHNRQSLAGSGFPDPHGIVMAGGGNPVAIGAEGQIRHNFVVPVERDAFLAASDVPEPRRVVTGCAGQGVAIGTER